MRNACALLVLATAGVLVAGDADARASITIGFISPLTGAIAAAGKDMYSGGELYWPEIGWQMSGRKVEVILEDNEGNPATSRDFPPCRHC
jgi:branched-chain amino acid transport system substrate-binding protein